MSKETSSFEMPKQRLTIRQFIRAQEAEHPEATGALSDIIRDLETVAKEISYTVNTAGLVGVHGYTGETNVQGEKVLKLDEQANRQFKEILTNNPNIAGFASEEEESFVAFPNGKDRKYVAWFDPLDGSSNFNTNVSIGSIFSIYRRVTESGEVKEEDFLQSGREQVCAGYFLYGSGTMFVYTTGDGVHGFTLDPSIGEFILSHENIRIPPIAKSYSINEGYSELWEPGVKEFIHGLKTREKPVAARYIGSGVADIHRIVLEGGLFLYPADEKHPKGKLRICCELNSLAYIIEQAGGSATNGLIPILDIKPSQLHERSPVAIGSMEEVEAYIMHMQKYL